MLERVFSRIPLPTAKALVAGTAILAGAFIPIGSAANAQDPSEDTALAIPRLAPPSEDGSVALPQPLTAGEANAVRAAFNSRSTPVEALKGNPLLGDVLADRYLSGPKRTAPAELRAWLAAYPDYPDAPAVYRLLTSRLPNGEPAPKAPALPDFTPAPYGDDIEAQAALLPRDPALDRRVHEEAADGKFGAAIRIVAHTKMTAEYGALLRAEVARAMFGSGDNEGALRVAEAADAQAHGQVGLAGWIAGLSAWRLGRPGLAGTMFERAYHAGLVVPGQRAGAAFWAARASMASTGAYGPWMYRAAQDPRTFYGLLARQVLHQPIPTEDAPDATLAEADVEAVQARPRGMRTFALLQAGERKRAAAELRLLWSETRDQPGFSRSVLVVARAAGLQDLAEQLDAVMQPARVRIPAQRLRPQGGFKVSPALIYAMTRLESNFDAKAVSPSGARGLMQLMPSTARYIQAGAVAPRLHDPAANLALGQKYLLHLEQLNHVGSDLIRLLASYNAGPGTMYRWLGTIGNETDPLLFIESLPGDETRAYVPRALAYTWLYAAQLGLPSPSLEELAAGIWPQLQAPKPSRQAVVRLH